MQEDPQKGEELSFTITGEDAEAQDALTVLGYSRAEALNILKDIDTSSMELEDILRAALKKLSK